MPLPSFSLDHIRSILEQRTKSFINYFLLVQSSDFGHSMTSSWRHDHAQTPIIVLAPSSCTKGTLSHFRISCGSKVTNENVPIFQILPVGQHIWHKNWHNRSFPDRGTGTIWNLLVISNRLTLSKAENALSLLCPKRPKSAQNGPKTVTFTSSWRHCHALSASDHRHPIGDNFPTTASIGIFPIPITVFEIFPKNLFHTWSHVDVFPIIPMRPRADFPQIFYAPTGLVRDWLIRCPFPNRTPKNKVIQKSPFFEFRLWLYISLLNQNQGNITHIQRRTKNNKNNPPD